MLLPASLPLHMRVMPFVEMSNSRQEVLLSCLTNESKIQNIDPLLMIHFVTHLIDFEKGLAVL